MRRRLSQGVRIYTHDQNGRSRDSYNYEQGKRELQGYLDLPKFWRLVAVGTEGGALVAHFRWVR